MGRITRPIPAGNGYRMAAQPVIPPSAAAGSSFVGAGGKATDTIINEGGGQSLKGLALNTTLNGGEQWMHMKVR